MEAFMHTLLPSRSHLLKLIIAMGLMAIGGFMAYWGIVTRLTFWTRHDEWSLSHVCPGCRR